METVLRHIPPNKIIVCDLDGTLAPSKSLMSPSMAQTISRILILQKFAVISGGSYKQFQKQFLGSLRATPEQLKNLYLFPVNGATCYVYDEEKDTWKQLYDDSFSTEERLDIIVSFNEAVREAGVKTGDEEGEVYGDLLDDRGEQVTFSGCGQEAPIAVKEAWDPDQKKRQKIVEKLIPKIKNAQVSIGGMTSIDVTHEGIDKAYAIEKMQKLLSLTDMEVVFLGDALFPHGNDEPAKKTGVLCIQVSGPEETEKLFSEYLKSNI